LRECNRWEGSNRRQGGPREKKEQERRNCHFGGDTISHGGPDKHELLEKGEAGGRDWFITEDFVGWVVVVILNTTAIITISGGL